MTDEREIAALLGEAPGPDTRFRLNVLAMVGAEKRRRAAMRRAVVRCGRIHFGGAGGGGRAGGGRDASGGCAVDDDRGGVGGGVSVRCTGAPKPKRAYGARERGVPDFGLEAPLMRRVARL